MNMYMFMPQRIGVSTLWQIAYTIAGKIIYKCGIFQQAAFDYRRVSLILRYICMHIARPLDRRNLSSLVVAFLHHLASLAHVQRLMPVSVLSDP